MEKLVRRHRAHCDVIVLNRRIALKKASNAASVYVLWCHHEEPEMEFPAHDLSISNRLILASLNRRLHHIFVSWQGDHPVVL